MQCNRHKTPKIRTSKRERENINRYDFDRTLELRDGEKWPLLSSCRLENRFNRALKLAWLSLFVFVCECMRVRVLRSAVEWGSKGDGEKGAGMREKGRDCILSFAVLASLSPLFHSSHSTCKECSLYASWILTVSLGKGLLFFFNTHIKLYWPYVGHMGFVLHIWVFDQQKIVTFFISQKGVGICSVPEYIWPPKSSLFD